MTAMISDSAPDVRHGMTPRRRSASGEVLRGRDAEQKIIAVMRA